MMAAMSPFPLYGHPLDVLGKIVEGISDLIERPSVVSFRIGYTDDLSIARQQCVGGHLFVLYCTDRTGDAVDLRDALVKAFLYHHKNRQEKNGGSLIPRDKTSYVYLAVWYDQKDGWPVLVPG
jgi:hypothetical protein